MSLSPFTGIARRSDPAGELRKADVVSSPLRHSLPLSHGYSAASRAAFLSYGTRFPWERARDRGAALLGPAEAAAGIVPISEAGRTLIRNVGLDKPRVHSIPFGVDEGFWRRQRHCVRWARP